LRGLGAPGEIGGFAKVDRRPVDPTGDIRGLGRLVKEVIAATAR
jgi:hypothetical protein